MSILVLTGCSPWSSTQYQAHLADAPVCCNNISELPILPLKTEEPTQLDIGKEQKKALVIDNAKTFAALVQLPLADAPYSIRIRCLSTKDSVFPPKIQLLNEDFSVARTYHSHEFRIQRGEYSKTVFFNTNNLGEKYLLIYKDSGLNEVSLQKTDIEIRNSVVVTPYFSFVLPLSSGDLVKDITPSVGGQVQLYYEIYKPAVIN